LPWARWEAKNPPRRPPSHTCTTLTRSLSSSGPHHLQARLSVPLSPPSPQTLPDPDSHVCHAVLQANGHKGRNGWPDAQHLAGQ
jgi:hypothetical protein